MLNQKDTSINEKKNNGTTTPPLRRKQQHQWSRKQQSAREDERNAEEEDELSLQKRRIGTRKRRGIGVGCTIFFKKAQEYLRIFT